MRIAMVVDRYVPEARSAAHLFHDLAHALSRRGHQVDVITKYPVENLPAELPPEAELDGPVTVRRIKSPFATQRAIWIRAVDQAVFAVKVAWTLLRHIDRQAPVIVYSPPLVLAAIVALTARMSGRPIVVNLHDIYPRTAVELGQVKSKVAILVAKLIERLVYRASHALVVPAPGSLAYLTDEVGIQPAKTTLVYNWVEAPDADSRQPRDRARASFGLTTEFVVTYAGVVGLAQDLSAILDAAKDLDPSENIIFMIVGEGPMLTTWMQQAKSLKGIRFLPTLPRDRYEAMLQASDVALLALSDQLRSPAIPGKLQSIMAAERPVVAVVPDRSDAALVVSESHCGLVTPPGDGAALLAAVRMLRDDQGAAREYAAAGHRFAKTEFTLERAANTFESILKSVTRSREVR